jgi:hypothetical protein
MSQSEPIPGNAPENRPESTHFVRKSGDFRFFNRTTVLIATRRKKRADAISAPPAAADALGPRGESLGKPGASRELCANHFRKSEYVLFSQPRRNANLHAPQKRQS